MADGVPNAIWKALDIPQIARMQVNSCGGRRPFRHKFAGKTATNHFPGTADNCPAIRLSTPSRPWGRTQASVQTAALFDFACVVSPGAGYNVVFCSHSFGRVTCRRRAPPASGNKRRPLCGLVQAADVSIRPAGDSDSGSFSVNVVPRPTSLSTRMRPLWASMILRHTDRPIPVPP